MMGKFVLYYIIGFVFVALGLYTDDKLVRIVPMVLGIIGSFYMALALIHYTITKVKATVAMANGNATPMEYYIASGNSVSQKVIVWGIVCLLCGFVTIIKMSVVSDEEFCGDILGKNCTGKIFLAKHKPNVNTVHSGKASKSAPQTENNAGDQQ